MALFITLLVILVLFTAGLALFLRNLLTKNITGATAHLEELNRDYTKKQQEASRKAQEADQYYKTTLEKARQDALQFKERVEKEAQAAGDKAIEEARQESERIVERANKTREMLIEEMERKIDEKALDRACELMEQVLPEHLRAQMHKQWVEELISAGLEGLGSLHLPADIQKAQLKSAFELSAKQRELLSEKLKAQLGREIILDEENDPGVVAGVIVSLGSLVLDGSLKNKIKEAARVRQSADKK